MDFIDDAWLPSNEIFRERKLYIVQLCSKDKKKPTLTNADASNGAIELAAGSKANYICQQKKVHFSEAN